MLLPARGAALLECLSNLAANELYSPAGAGGEQAALAAVVDGVESLRRQCEALVVVTGEVFSKLGVDMKGYAYKDMWEIPVPICVCWPRQTGRLPPGRTLFVRWRAACRAIIKERGPRCDAA